ncbi:pyrroline-5-carboxylate reductase family protein [Streptomyces sp. H34-S4]|uniref:pyrroline-5-carboxylate reductase family protein n=1 Tax=Streptomyces sp. H34-S4 TaxID=2996463 RepID=UPI00226DB2A6|nr:pyrroline-5-carboxylate reductase dimerization domain-containing protein [Streptomyces sp. H34-S4]MCY0939420.1 NAD(P)-binding domain-containing protein [Streptomyces sp. H34-S4]
MTRPEILVVEPRAKHAQRLREEYGITTAPAQKAAEPAETVLIAVRPQDVPGLLAGIASPLRHDCLLVSAAAGVPTRLIERYVADDTPVVRAMPNTPVLVGTGMYVISAGSSAAEAHLLRAEEPLSPVGEAIRLDESMQDVATALSGSAPAYFYYVVENLIDAGTGLGVSREAAYRSGRGVGGTGRGSAGPARFGGQPGGHRIRVRVRGRRRRSHARRRDAAAARAGSRT